MIKTIHKTSAGLIILLGIVHASLTPVIMNRFSVSAMYFAAAGLAMIAIGFLNIILNRNKEKDRLIPILCHVANILFLVFGILTTIVLDEPQAYFGLILLISLTITALIVKNSTTK